jgi:hypothetical protein
MIYHTSYEENITWSDDGRFGEFAFFAHDGFYFGDFTYQIDECEVNIADLSEVHCSVDELSVSGFIERIQDIIECDSEQAFKYLCEKDFYTNDAEINWEIQKITAEMCDYLGFDGVAVTDEYGTSYMINVNKHADKIEKVK